VHLRVFVDAALRTLRPASDAATRSSFSLTRCDAPLRHAGAWASAVQRDPQHLEGLALNCESTNGRLRSVYDSHMNLQSPSGQTYESQAALAAVNRLCPHGRDRGARAV
jgi:hypothetical protein